MATMDNYVVLQTVEFYMYKRRPIKEYVHASDGTIVPLCREPGYNLIFSFVRGRGNASTFGKDSAIFYE